MNEQKNDLVERIAKELKGIVITHALGDDRPRLYLSPKDAAIFIAAALAQADKIATEGV